MQTSLDPKSMPTETILHEEDSKQLAEHAVCQVPVIGEMAKTKRLLDFEISSWDSDHYFIRVGNLKL